MRVSSWIAISWFSPLFGSLLYLIFGINRVSRLTGPLLGASGIIGPGSVSQSSLSTLDSLRLVVGRITGVEESTGTITEILEWGDEAYPSMLDAIENARRSIALSTFIFRDDEVGRQFIDALGRAHRRGVAVRVLIDGFGGGYFRSVAYHLLRRQDVPAARFLHSSLPWKMPLLDMRLHKKSLIIDCEKAFVGGLNIAADNMLSQNPRNPVRDVHFSVVGPVVIQILKSFQEDWFFTTSELLAGDPWLPKFRNEFGKPARAISSGPDQNVDHLVLVLLSAINLAKNTVQIATPYFLPDEAVMIALQLAALRGVAVDLVMPEHNNHRVVAWAARQHVRPLLRAGCRIWLSPQPFDHSKIVTVDDYWCLIGSANWDARSFRLNFELTVEFYDEDLARRLSEMIRARSAIRLTIMDLDKRWGIIKIRDAAARLLMPYL